MQIASGQNQLILQQGINNQTFDQKVEGKRFTLYNTEKSHSCSPVKNIKIKDKREEEKLEIGCQNENILNAICSNLKLFYEIEIEQSNISFSQQINNLQMLVSQKDAKEESLISQIKKIKAKSEQIQIEHEISIKDLNHKYNYQMQLFKCQIEQQINEYTAQIVDVMSKNSELLEILSMDYEACQKYKRLFKDYKNGQAYQDLMTKNINLTNEIRNMKIDMQVLQQDNQNYTYQINKLTKKVNLFQRLNEERQQEIIEKDQIIKIYDQQTDQMHQQYKILMQEFSSKVLSFIKQKDTIQEEIIQKLQQEVIELEILKKDFIHNDKINVQQLNKLNSDMKEFQYIKLKQNQQNTKLEQQVKHLIEQHTLEIECIREDTNKLMKIQEKNNEIKNDQHNNNILNQKNYYEKQLTDWKNNYYKVSQKLCELEQNITNGPKFYLQKAYEDYQQNIQRTIENAENKISDTMTQSNKMQEKISTLSNENSILKEQIIELKDQSQNYLSNLHNQQKECLASYEKSQSLSLLLQQTQNELQETKVKFVREKEQKEHFEKESIDSQYRLEQQVQNLKREIMQLTQSAKQNNQTTIQNNSGPQLRVDKINYNTANKNPMQETNSASTIRTKTLTNHNQSNNIFKNLGFEMNNSDFTNNSVNGMDQSQYMNQIQQLSQADNLSQAQQLALFEQAYKLQASPLQNSTVQREFQQNQINMLNLSMYGLGDFWQMQQFCFKMIGDFQIKFEQQMNTIKLNMDKQHHNNILKEIKLAIEKDTRVLDLPFEEKKQFTLKATDYYGQIIQGRIKDLKIENLIHEIGSLIKSELKEKVSISIQLEKAIKENIQHQKSSQNRIGHESEEFKNILQNQINRLFKNIQDIDAQKLHQIETREIEIQIKKQFQDQFEMRLNLELEENKRFIEGMKEEYQNLVILHDKQVRDITINLGAEIDFLQKQLEKKMNYNISFNSKGNIESGNYHIYPQTQIFKQQIPVNGKSNFLKSSSYSFNKENFSKGLQLESDQIQRNTSQPIINDEIQDEQFIQSIQQGRNQKSQQQKRSLQKQGVRQLQVTHQQYMPSSDVSTISSSKQGGHFLKKMQASSSIDKGQEALLSATSADTKFQDIFALSKPSLSYSFDVSKEVQHPSSNKSDIYSKKGNKLKYLNQSIDALEGIREEKQNKFRDFLDEDILDLNSSLNNNHVSFNDSQLRRTYQHFILSSKSVEPGANRNQQSSIGTRKNILNSTISVLKDIQSSSKSNGRRFNRNTIQSQSPSLSQNSNNKPHFQYPYKHFIQQSNQNRQTLKLNQLAIMSNDQINIGLQSTSSMKNNPILSSLSKQ